jgi:hypothetical protein
MAGRLGCCKVEHGGHAELPSAEPRRPEQPRTLPPTTAPCVSRHGLGLPVSARRTRDRLDSARPSPPGLPTATARHVGAVFRDRRRRSITRDDVVALFAGRSGELHGDGERCWGAEGPRRWEPRPFGHHGRGGFFPISPAQLRVNARRCPERHCDRCSARGVCVWAAWSPVGSSDSSSRRFAGGVSLLCGSEASRGVVEVAWHQLRRRHQL